jgi:hypothetical protein
MILVREVNKFTPDLERPNHTSETKNILGHYSTYPCAGAFRKKYSVVVYVLRG